MDEVLKGPAQLVVAVVVEAFDGGLLDGPVHPLHLSVRPGMGDPGQPVLDAVLGQHRVDGIRHRRDQVAQELGRDHLAGLLMQFGIVRSMATNRRSLPSAVCTSAMSMWSEGMNAIGPRKCPNADGAAPAGS